MKTFSALALLALLASACACADGPAPTTRAAAVASAPGLTSASPYEARRGEGSARAARADR